MRVLHLSKYFPPHPGGIERYVQLLARAQAASGLSPAVLAHGTRGRPRPQRAWREDGVHLAEARTLAELAFTPLSPSWPLRLAGLLRRFRPDLLHVHLPNPWSFCLLAMPAARRLPWVLHWHADVPDDVSRWSLRLALPTYRRCERALLARAAAVIATSSSYADSSPTLRAHARAIDIVPLAVAEPALPASSRTAWPGPGLKLLSVGRLTYYKGLQVLLDAVACTPGCSLLLIGEGEDRPALERRLGEPALAGRVRLVGGVGDAALEAAYRDADVLCLASIDRAEAFGLVLLEAMRAGRPCIASRVPGSGMTEVVEHEVSGLLVEPGNAAALAAAIARYRDDPTLGPRHGASGRVRWERDFRIEAGAAAISAIYHRLLGTA